MGLYNSNSPDARCPLCRKYKLVSESELKHYEEVIKLREEQKREVMEEHERRKRRLRENPPRVIDRKRAGGAMGKPSF